MVDDRDVTMNEDAPAAPDAPAIAAPPAAAVSPEAAAVSPAALGPKRALQIFAAFLGTQVAVAVVVGVYAWFHPVAPGGAGFGGSTVGLRLVLEAALGGTLLSGLVALALVRRLFASPGGDEARAAIGWRAAPARATARAALQGLALVAAFVAVSAAAARTHGLGPLDSAAHAGGWARVAWAVLALVLAPPIEELVFRGVLYAGFARRWRPRVAGALSTLLFVVLHVTELGSFVPAWLVIGTLGVLALRARLASGSLVPAIALHASYNLGFVLLAYAR
jgi:CAAX protease family protein